MVAIGCDHGGFELKGEIISHFKERGIEYIDLGTDSPDSVDYPIYAQKVCQCVLDGKAQCGILVCGTGIGMSIAANKIKGIRAAVCGDAFSTEFTRRHNDTNIMCLGGRVISTENALKLVGIFLNTPFEGGRHQRRIDMIAALENGVALNTEE